MDTNSVTKRKHLALTAGTQDAALWGLLNHDPLKGSSSGGSDPRGHSLNGRQSGLEALSINCGEESDQVKVQRGANLLTAPGKGGGKVRWRWAI